MFHPLLMVTYGVILALSFTYLAIYPPTMKMFLVGGAFLSTAVVPGIFIFLMVKTINQLHKLGKKDEEPQEEEEPAPTSEELLTEIRDLLKEQQK